MTQNTKIEKKTRINSELKLIDTDSITVSDTPLQALRRQRMNDENLVELSASIKKNGLIHSILVRETEPDVFQIVAGERRYRASLLAELKEVKCEVRELSDEQAEDIQIQENLFRKNPHPLDEAVGYQQLMDNHKLSYAELSARVGKSVKFVKLRLVLNKLIPEALKDVQQNLLPTRHAEEIAKHSPEKQKLILENIVYVHNEKENGAETFRALRREIDRRIKLALAHAPFDTASTELRKDGLTCVECPQRTGAQADLFEEEDLGENDKCLNKECFQGKILTQITVSRKEIAKQENIRGYKSVPTIAESYYNAPDEFPDTLLNSYYGKTFHALEENEMPCDDAGLAVWVDGKKIGQQQVICTNKSCRTHFKKRSAEKSVSSEADLEEKRIRREEILDTKVCEPIREQVFARAKNKYTERNWFFDEPDKLSEMVARLFYSVKSDSRNRFEMICRIMEFDEKKIRGNDYYIGLEQVIKFCEKLTKDRLSELVFLAMRVQTDEMFVGETYKSQKAVKKLAEESGFDYALADAENRVALSSKKHLPVFEKHLEKVKEGRKSKIPRVFSANYKQKS